MTTTDKLTALKQEATNLGIDFHPSIGVIKLTEKIKSFKENSQINAAVVEPIKRVESIPARNTRLRNEAGKLIRIRITCMNPNKRNWPGEIFSVSNKVIGTFKKFIPFNAGEAGYHVPNIIYQHLLERQCQIFVKTTLPNGKTTNTGKLIREFNIEKLPPLTAQELKDLADKQAINHSIG